jgi:hypothetical protein
MKRYILPFACAALALLLACPGEGGGRVIEYADPAAGDGFRFVKNAQLSTPTHLVLDLVAAGQEYNCSGLAFDVQHGAPGAVAWAKVAASDATYVRNGAVFALGTGTAGLAATVAPAATQLKAVVGQKGIASSKNPNSGVLASVALDLAPGAPTGGVTFSVGKFQVVPGTRTAATIPPTSVRFGALTVVGYEMQIR